MIQFVHELSNCLKINLSSIEDMYTPWNMDNCIFSQCSVLIIFIFIKKSIFEIFTVLAKKSKEVKKNILKK